MPQVDRNVDSAAGQPKRLLMRLVVRALAADHPELFDRSGGSARPDRHAVKKMEQDDIRGTSGPSAAAEQYVPVTAEFELLARAFGG